MNRKIFLVLILLAALHAGAAAADRNAPPAREGELRGVWIHSPTMIKDWDAAMRHLKECGINAVFANFCDGTSALYPSKVLPRARKGKDYVALACRACRKHGLELHAWRVDFKGYLYRRAQEFMDEGRLVTRNDGRAYLAKNVKNRYWLCPSHPKNVELEAAAMAELAKNYDLDGVHMDYIRFPQTNYVCFCENCRAHFLKKTGLKDVKWPEDVMKEKDRRGRYHDLFVNTKQDHVTNVVREISKRVRAIKPDMKISAAVFPSRDYALSIGQNWLDWIERGYVDFVCPMDYVTDPEKLRRMVRNQAGLIKGRAPFYPGFGRDRTAELIEAARGAGGDGFMIFQYKGVNTKLGRMLPVMAESVIRGRTYTNHTAPEIRFELAPRGERLTGKVTCTTRVPGSNTAARVEIAPAVETVHGQKKTELPGKTTTSETTLEVDAPLARPSRLAVYGTIHYGDGTTRRFARRSAIFGLPK